MSLVTDYLHVEVTKREGFSIQKTKRGEHILITKKLIVRPSVILLKSISYVIKQETGKMQAMS